MNSLASYFDGMIESRRMIGSPPPGFRFACFEELVRERGREFMSTRLSEEQAAFVRQITGRRSFRLRECFFNAQTVVAHANSPRVRYAEGYAQGRAILPVLHGWIVLDGSAVIDLTWRTTDKASRKRFSDRVLGEIPSGWCYVGIEFSTEDVIRRLVSTGFASSFIDDLEGGFPLLRG